MAAKNNSLLTSSTPLKIPPCAFLAPSNSVKNKLFQKLRQQQISPGAKSQSYLADSIALQRLNRCSITGPFMGSSAAAVACELLISSGVDSLLLIGTAGGICSEKAEIRIGDLVFPRQIFSEEGTSKLYGADDVEPAAESELQIGLEKEIRQSIYSLEQCSFNIHDGGIWSTDAPFLESAEKIKHYAHLGAIAVEMEYAAVARLARIHKIKLGAIFIVSDRFAVSEHGEYSWESGFKSRQLRNSLSFIIDNSETFLSIMLET